jgi:tripartite-type tricarboxylate transporter receptor subunit TctC
VYIAFAAGGNLAMEAGVRAAPDGHTLVMVGPAAAINGTLYKKLAFSPNRDLVPISLMTWGPYAMYVSATLLFALAAGIDMTHVPYKGIQPAAPDLVSGDVQLVFNAFGPLNAFVHSGKIRLLGVTSASRLAQYPDVPTLAESGLPGFDASGWYMLFALRPIAQTLDEAAVPRRRDREVGPRGESLGCHGGLIA